MADLNSAYQEAKQTWLAAEVANGELIQLYFASGPVVPGQPIKFPETITADVNKKIAESKRELAERYREYQEAHLALFGDSLSPF